MSLLLKDVEVYLTTAQVHYLSKEEAIAWIVYRLGKVGQEWPSQLMRSLQKQYPGMSLSDTVLYAAIKALSDEGLITCEVQKDYKGRGRPKNFYSLAPGVDYSGVTRAWDSQFGEGIGHAA